MKFRQCKIEKHYVQKFLWIVIDQFEMQLITFHSNSNIKKSLVTLRVDLESTKMRLKKEIQERRQITLAKNLTFEGLKCFN